MDNIQDMLESVISGLSIIWDTLGKKRNEQMDNERAKMDFFMPVYGLFDPTRKADIAKARARILDAEGESMTALSCSGFPGAQHVYALDQQQLPPASK